MRKHSYLISVLILILSGILCTTMMSAGAGMLKCNGQPLVSTPEEITHLYGKKRTANGEKVNGER